MIESFAPIYDKNCRVLILGSCPSVESLAKGEYYGNRQNRFWRVMFRLLGEEYSDDYSVKTGMLLRHGVALWDTIGSCARQGSLDSAIKDVRPNDVAALIRDGGVRCVALNGGKAKAVFRQQVDADVVFLPSTSPANARMDFETLFSVWQKTLSPYLR